MNISAEIKIIDRAVEAHQIKEIWALFSGGHDSLISTYIASHHPLFKGVLHVNTGIGIKDTRKFVIEVCKQYRWALQIYSAKHNTKADGTPDPMIYRDLVLRWGFPGANLHQFMYSRLKERQILRFMRDKKFVRIGLITGARIAESERRKRNFKNGLEIFRREGSRVWISPTLQWSDTRCKAYMDYANLPRNPVKDNLCMSGECLCGAYAQPNELTQLEVFYPEVAAEIKTLEAEVKANGFPWGWEEQPPAWWRRKKQYEQREEGGQLNLLSFLSLAEACHEIEDDNEAFLPLCSSCQQMRQD